MRCPQCAETDTRVVDSRVVIDGVRRRRECGSCGARFTTFERIERPQIWVLKRDGTKEPFDREKVLAGVRHATRKRPFSPEDLDAIVARVVRQLDDRKEAAVPSTVVGEIVMAALREVDEVAFLRFASVYQAFDNVEQFIDAIAPLRDSS